MKLCIAKIPNASGNIIKSERGHSVKIFIMNQNGKTIDRIYYDPARMGKPVAGPTVYPDQDQG